MSNPRMVIADEDVEYIFSLQQKIIEDHFNDVEIELVTDRIFFNQLFSEPQSVDILIISRELYDDSINRHNIKTVFILSEQPQLQDDDEHSIFYLFKYSSLSDLIENIYRRSFLEISLLQKVKKGDTTLIVFCSGNGGTGKTTVALGIANCLAENRKKVLYINSANFQTFGILLDNATPAASNTIIAELCSASENIYNSLKRFIRNEGFSYLPPLRTSLMSIGIDQSIYKKIALSAKDSKEYDYIVLDVNNPFSEYQFDLIDIADKVVIVTRQNKASFVATNCLANNIDGIKSDKFSFVCNDFYEDENNCYASSNLNQRFSISDYVRHFDKYDALKAKDFANDKSIKKIAYALMQGE